MGEAKRRGTAEERIAQGIEKRKKKEEAEALAREQFLISLTPEQRKKIENNKKLVNFMISMAATSRAGLRP